MSVFYGDRLEVKNRHIHKAAKSEPFARWELGLAQWTDKHLTFWPLSRPQKTDLSEYFQKVSYHQSAPDFIQYSSLPRETKEYNIQLFTNHRAAPKGVRNYNLRGLSRGQLPLIRPAKFDRCLKCWQIVWNSFRSTLRENPRSVWISLIHISCNGQRQRNFPE